MEAVSYVEWPEFISVVLGVVALTLGISAILFGKITAVNDKVQNVSEKAAVAEKQNETDKESLKIIFSKIETMEKDRMQDKLMYIETINKLNLTLKEIEVTLENNNKIVGELSSKIK